MRQTSAGFRPLCPEVRPHTNVTGVGSTMRLSLLPCSVAAVATGRGAVCRAGLCTTLRRTWTRASWRAFLVNHLCKLRKQQGGFGVRPCPVRWQPWQRVEVRFVVLECEQPCDEREHEHRGEPILSMTERITKSTPFPYTAGR